MGFDSSKEITAEITLPVVDIFTSLVLTHSTVVQHLWSHNCSECMKIGNNFTIFVFSLGFLLIGWNTELNAILPPTAVQIDRIHYFC